MDLFLDEELGVLRCRTRSLDSILDYDTKYPILLPPESPFTALLIKDTHHRVMHAGKAQTVAAIRTEFWVPRLTKLTAKILRGCTICRRAYGSAYPLPAPPPLPDSRVPHITDAFSKVGVDYAGPFYTRERFEDKTFVDYKSCLGLHMCSD